MLCSLRCAYYTVWLEVLVETSSGAGSAVRGPVPRPAAWCGREGHVGQEEAIDLN